MKNIITTSIIGLTTSFVATYSIEDINQLIQISVQILIGIITIYKLINAQKGKKIK